MSNRWIAIILLIATAPVCGADQFNWKKTDHAVALMRDGKVIWQHNHNPAEGKPYFHPLATIKGTVLTELRPRDHVWHRAGWWSWKFIDGLNYWEEDRKTLRSQGLTEIKSTKIETNADHSATIDIVISYHPPDKPELLSETRTLKVSAPDARGNYHIDWTSSFTAAADITLERTPIPGQPRGAGHGGYAGFSIRAALALRHWNFLDDAGRINKTHGQQARWVSFGGTTKAGEDAALVILDHPQNPGSPTRWYLAKGMPYFSPAILFAKGRTLKAGEKLQYNYRILIESKRSNATAVEQSYQAYAGGKPIRLLMIDGQNNHDWKTTTPFMKKILEATGRFDVSVLTSPPKGSAKEAWENFKPRFSDFDVVLLNYFGQDWPGDTLKQMTDYVAAGGGFVAVHAAIAPFQKDIEFNKLIGVGWRPAVFGKRLYLDASGQLRFERAGKGPGAGHSRRHAYKVDTRDATHPIMRGLGSSWMHAVDELYNSQRGPASNMNVIATALSPVTKVHEPLIWTIPYGKGRSFVTALGHDTTSMASEGFRATLARGCEWAATGKVTLPNTVSDSASLAKLEPRKNKPTWKTIKAHIDPNVQVYGRYAAVKLPVTKGVKLWNPTAIKRGPGGVMYAANYTGEIYSLVDTDGDGLEDTAKLFCNVKDDKLRYPTCMAWKGKDLYVGTTQQIRIYTDTDGDGQADSSRVFFDDFPWTLHVFDWTFGLTFGPDDHAYVIFCTDYLNGGRAPDPKGYRGAIVRISPDGKKAERFATGLRYAYGMAFNEKGDLFFSDNRGGGNPTEEFNHAIRGSYHGHDKTNKYPNHPPATPTLVEVKYGFGSGGLAFNPPSNNYDGTGGQIFQACWGPDGKFDRGSITRVKLQKLASGSYRAKEYPVADRIAKVIDLAFGKDGDMYVAQFGTENRAHTPYKTPMGAIYRFFDAPWVKPASYGKAPLVKGNIENGEKLFAARACNTCHSLDRNKQLLGPSLDAVGEMFNRQEIITAITEPGGGIKSGFETQKLTQHDGTILLGRIAESDSETLTLLMPGNITKRIAHATIKSINAENISLMPTDLLKGLTENEINDLLAYLKIRDGHAAPYRPTAAPIKKPKAKNLARSAKASSPDDLEKDGDASGDQAGIDGNPATYWDEVNNKSLYRYRIDWQKPQTISAIGLMAFHHHQYAARDFEIICDGKVITTVKNARYTNNFLVVRFAKTQCRSLELKITGRYGPSPAIRELEVYNLDGK